MIARLHHTPTGLCHELLFNGPRFDGYQEFRRAYAKPSDGFANSPESIGGLAGGKNDRTERRFAVDHRVKFPGWASGGRPRP